MVAADTNSAVMSKPTIEDMIYQRWDGEGAFLSALSFGPLYQFLSTVAHMARMDERQTILDLVHHAREQGNDPRWNAGYNAALSAVIRTVVERAQAP